jgi:hypothetical protein
MEHFSDFQNGNHTIVPVAQHFALQNAGRPMVAPTIGLCDKRKFESGQQAKTDRGFPVCLALWISSRNP